MNDSNTDPDGEVEHPGSVSIVTLPTVQVTPAAERETLSIMRSRAKFAGSTEVRAMCAQLLGAGYTPAETASRLKLHPGTVYDLSKEPKVREAIAAGVERRREALGHGLQAAAGDALQVLSMLMNDPAVPPKERIKAAETLLERSGITPDTSGAQVATAAVSVDVDFDNRLARIVAAGGSQNIGD
tara:strand:+ start:355 stop:909 length:555 start_codon:yes stop_codon:yes gene_type:complete